MSPKKLFVTGGSGFIGSSIVREAVAQGYHVRGLSRSEASDEKLKNMGCEPVRGDLTSLDVMSREAADADVVCHCGDAFMGSGFTMPYPEAVEITNAAVDAMAGAMEGTNKPLVVASGCRITKADPTGRETTEEDPEDDESYFDRRVPNAHAMAWASRGVRVSAVRIAPFVHGQGGSLGAVLMETAKAAGAAFIINGGLIFTSSVHVDDVGRQFLLAAEKSAPGEGYNCTSETSITIAALMGEVATAVGVPVVDVGLEEAKVKLGPLFADYLNSPCRASSEKAKRLLGWEPKEIGILEDIRGGSYEAVKAAIRTAV